MQVFIFANLRSIFSRGGLCWGFGCWHLREGVRGVSQTSVAVMPARQLLGTKKNRLFLVLCKPQLDESMKLGNFF